MSSWFCHGCRRRRCRTSGALTRPAVRPVGSRGSQPPRFEVLGFSGLHRGTEDEGFRTAQVRRGVALEDHRSPRGEAIRGGVAFRSDQLPDSPIRAELPASPLMPIPPIPTKWTGWGLKNISIIVLFRLLAGCQSLFPATRHFLKPSFPKSGRALRGPRFGEGARGSAHSLQSAGLEPISMRTLLSPDRAPFISSSRTRRAAPAAANASALRN